MAARDRRALHALRRRRAMGPGGAARERRAVSGRRCGRAPGVSWRVDLGLEVQQRPHQCRRGGDAVAGARAAARRGGARVASPAGSPAVGAGAVRRRSSDPAVRPRAARRLPQPRRVWRAVGDAAVGGRRHRPAAVHGLSADAARYRAPGGSAAADVGGARTSDGARPVCATDPARARCDRAPGGGAVRHHERLRPVQAADTPLLCRGQLQRDGAATGAPRSRARISAVRSPDVRAGHGGHRRGRQARADRSRAREPLRRDRSRHRAVRSRGARRRRPARLVPGRSPRTSSQAGTSWAPHGPRSTRCSRGAALPPARRTKLRIADCRLQIKNFADFTG